MIEHVVLIKPRPDVATSAIAALWTGLDGLIDAIPGIVTLAAGENVSPEQKDEGFTLGFIVTFVDAAARDHYLTHPDHLAVVPLVRAVAADTIVFDLEHD